MAPARTIYPADWSPSRRRRFGRRPRRRSPPARPRGMVTGFTITSFGSGYTSRPRRSRSPRRWPRHRGRDPQRWLDQRRSRSTGRSPRSGSKRAARATQHDAATVTIAAPASGGTRLATPVVAPFGFTGLTRGSGYLVTPADHLLGWRGPTFRRRPRPSCRAARSSESTSTVPGSGYTSAPTVTFSAPPAGGTTATVSTTFGTNEVTGIIITNAGNRLLEHQSAERHHRRPHERHHGRGHGHVFHQPRLQPGGAGYLNPPGALIGGGSGRVSSRNGDRRRRTMGWSSGSRSRAGRATRRCRRS